MVAIRSLFVITLFFALVFADNLKGSLTSAGISAVFPGDKRYGNASTPFNLRFTFQPAAVTFPKTPKDVSKIVKIGTSLGLQIVARSGGHSYIANGLGGRNGSLVVDLSNFKAITANPSNGTALIESGNRLGDIALALNDAGRALPHGSCPYVGIGGHSSMPIHLYYYSIPTSVCKAMVGSVTHHACGDSFWIILNPSIWS